MLARLKMSVLLVLLLAGCIATPRPEGADPAILPPTILISIDGFRPDYLDRGVTPRLNALAAAGARAEFMRPSFPSITFPNHYTLVTGLRPDHHGIVGNVIDDPALPVRFSLSNHAALTDRRWWDGAEPIWVTAEKHKVRTATLFWPGSEAAIHGVRPAQWQRFDATVSNAARVDTVLGWLTVPPAARPRFLTLYFDAVDHEGHLHGPAAPEVTRAAADVDTAIGRLVDGLAARSIAANLIVVSDHGMAAVAPDRVIRLSQLAPAGSYRVTNTGPYAGLAPAPGQEAVLAAALLAPHAHAQCWRKRDIPPRFAYGHNRRVPPFICLADVGWLIAEDGAAGETKNFGAHGYDNQAPEMRAIFIAAGPSIRPGVRLPGFDNVDVYPFVMRLIGLPARRSDGEIAPLLPAVK